MTALYCSRVSGTLLKQAVIHHGTLIRMAGRALANGSVFIFTLRWQMLAETPEKAHQRLDAGSMDQRAAQGYRNERHWVSS
jgi:hypothetical protein